MNILEQNLDKINLDEDDSVSINKELEALDNLKKKLNMLADSKEKIAELNIELNNGESDVLIYFHGDNIDLIIDEFFDYHKINVEFQEKLKTQIKMQIKSALIQYIEKINQRYEQKIETAPVLSTVIEEKNEELISSSNRFFDNMQTQQYNEIPSSIEDIIYNKKKNLLSNSNSSNFEVSKEKDSNRIKLSDLSKINTDQLLIEYHRSQKSLKMKNDECISAKKNTNIQNFNKNYELLKIQSARRKCQKMNEIKSQRLFNQSQYNYTPSILKFNSSKV